MDGFEILEHTADVGLRARASSLETLFVQAAAGLYAIAWEGTIPAAPGETIHWSYTGDSWEGTLIHFLNELVFQLFTKNRAARKLACRLTPGFGLELTGEWAAASPGGLKLEIKSATYHQIRLTQTVDGWQAVVYFDV